MGNADPNRYGEASQGSNGEKQEYKDEEEDNEEMGAGDENDGSIDDDNAQGFHTQLATDAVNGGQMIGRFNSQYDS